jgi:hypothetical protein
MENSFFEEMQRKVTEALGDINWLIPRLVCENSNNRHAPLLGFAGAALNNGPVTPV